MRFQDNIFFNCAKNGAQILVHTTKCNKNNHISISIQLLVIFNALTFVCFCIYLHSCFRFSSMVLAVQIFSLSELHKSYLIFAWGHFIKTPYLIFWYHYFFKNVENVAQNGLNKNNICVYLCCIWITIIC